MNKQDKIMEALKDALAFSAEPSMSLDELKARAVVRVNGTFGRMDKTTQSYSVDGTVSAVMREFAVLRFEPYDSFVKALEKQCTSARFFQSRKNCTIFKFCENYVTWFNNPENDVTTVQISRYIP